MNRLLFGAAGLALVGAVAVGWRVLGTDRSREVPARAKTEAQPTPTAEGGRRSVLEGVSVGGEPAAPPAPEPNPRDPAPLDPDRPRPHRLEVPEEAPSLAGLEVESLGAADREKLGVPDDYGTGVRITRVHPDAPAAEAGLRAGDVIVRAMREDVNEPADLTRAVGRRDHSVLIAVRNGQMMQLVVQPPYRPEPAGSN